MPMSPEKIKMYSLTESGSDLASFSPDLSQNEEEIRSKEKSPLDPASPFDEHPEPSPNQATNLNEKLPDGSSPYHEENPNLCTNQNKEPVESPAPRTNLKEQVEEHIQMPANCSEDQSHGTAKRFSFSHMEGGGAEKATVKEKAITAASDVLRKLPAWASNKSAEDENVRRCESKIQTENKGTDFPLAWNLQQVIEAFSGDFDEKKYADMDILEVAKMKGIVFENPSWWPPEGFPDSL